MKFLFADEDLVIIDKPAGYYVHPPTESLGQRSGPDGVMHDHFARHPVARSLICLYHVRNILKQKVYPVHRLDVATSGILIFAKSSTVASRLQLQFARGEVTKVYHAITRGFVPEKGEINFPLTSHSGANPALAATKYKRLATLELPFQASPRYPGSRYSFVEVQPLTGRHHQIRRHFSQSAYPLVGDGCHGDSRHNTFFREHLGIEGLCLRAQALSFTHPTSGVRIQVVAGLTPKWQALRALAWVPMQGR